MKQKLLLTALLFASYFSYAQFEVRDKSTDALITNNQTLNFNESGCAYSEPCNWGFEVTNTSSSDIYMRIFIDDMTNTDGSQVQLCFAGTCLNSVALNNGYPANAALIASGATSSAGNYFWNQHPAGTATAMSWTLRFQAFDGVGGNEIGTPLSVIYNYDPNLSTDDVQKPLDVNVFPSVVTNTLNIVSKDQLQVEFFNLLGQNVKQVKVDTNTSIIDVSNLSAQPYILRLTNLNGASITKKIVVK
ncbi:MAG: T9SS type A sorting domain-containing protein [Flavobacteriaceae bacterium]|nr:T9SS type A sorting domain-containing protein [Flavobacteriaceae bacterium]